MQPPQEAGTLQSQCNSCTALGWRGLGSHSEAGLAHSFRKSIACCFLTSCSLDIFFAFIVSSWFNNIPYLLSIIYHVSIIYHLLIIYHVSIIYHLTISPSPSPSPFSPGSLAFLCKVNSLPALAVLLVAPAHADQCCPLALRRLAAQPHCPQPQHFP